MAETGGNCPALKNEEKLHGQEDHKSVCIVNAGRNLIAPDVQTAGQAMQEDIRKNEYILHRQLDIYCNCP